MKIISESPGGEPMNGILPMFYFSWLINIFYCKTGLFPLTICKYLPLNGILQESQMISRIICYLRDACRLAYSLAPAQIVRICLLRQIPRTFWFRFNLLLLFNPVDNFWQLSWAATSGLERSATTQVINKFYEQRRVTHTRAPSCFRMISPKNDFVFECIERTVTK